MVPTRMVPCLSMAHLLTSSGRLRVTDALLVGHLSAILRRKGGAVKRGPSPESSRFVRKSHPRHRHSLSSAPRTSRRFPYFLEIPRVILEFPPDFGRRSPLHL